MHLSDPYSSNQRELKSVAMETNRLWPDVESSDGLMVFLGMNHVTDALMHLVF
jgi:hypothetical protein